MAQVNAKSLVESAVVEQGFPFLSLHTDIRYLIYKEFLTQRTIILQDCLEPAYTRERRRRHYRIRNPNYAEENNVALLQACKQIYIEAQPLLLYVPSQLVLSRELYKIPGVWHFQRLKEGIGVPLDYITHLRLNAKVFGNSTRLFPVCPQLSQPLHRRRICGRRPRLSRDEGPPPEPQRSPDLGGLASLSDFLCKCLPSLRELHIYDVLSVGKSWSKPPCGCAIAGTSRCACGKCSCSCVTHPPVRSQSHISLSETKSKLYHTFLSRMRAALPEDEHLSRETQFYSSYHVVVNLLARGVHVFLHDEVTLIASKDGNGGVFKGVWRANYHIIPPEEAEAPKDPPTEFVESPRQRRRRREKEQEAGDVGKKSDVPHGLESPFDFFGALTGPEMITVCSENFPMHPLKDYEAILDVNIANEFMFDVEIDESVADAVPAWAERRCGKLWKWS